MIHITRIPVYQKSSELSKFYAPEYQMILAYRILPGSFIYKLVCKGNTAVVDKTNVFNLMYHTKFPF